MSSAQKIIKWSAIGLAGFLAISIIGAIASTFVWIVGAFIPGNTSSKHNEDAVVIKEQEEHSYSGIDNLKLSCGVFKVAINTDNSVEGVKVITQNCKNQVKIRKEGNTLVLEETSFNIQNILGGKKSYKGKVNIYLPANKEFDKVEIEAGVGSLNLDRIQCKTFDVECGVGSLDCNNVKAQKADIEGGVGELNIKNIEFTDAEVEGGIGKVALSGKILGNGKMSAGMGNLDIDLNNRREDFNIKVETGLGTIRIDGDKFGEGDWNSTNASQQLTVEGGVGEVNVDFIQE